MIHVYVETNFIIDLLRPFSTVAARYLLDRHGRDLTLHLPWCAFTEARRTLERIIHEDLGFVDKAGRFLRMTAQGNPAITASQRPVNDFIREVRASRQQALFDYLDRLRELADRVAVVQPSERAVAHTVDLFRTKQLKPFDEMVLGTVLADAGERQQRGEGPLYFCNKNTKDFEPTSGNGLDAEYSRVGLTYLPSFDVP